MQWYFWKWRNWIYCHKKISRAQRDGQDIVLQSIMYFGKPMLLWCWTMWCICKDFCWSGHINLWDTCLLRVKVGLLLNSINAFTDALKQNDAKSLLINCCLGLFLGLRAFLQRSQSSLSSGDHARTGLAPQAQIVQGRTGATLAHARKGESS